MICPLCSKLILCSRNLPSHIRHVHENDRTFKCDSPCKHKSKTQHRLDSHKLSNLCLNYQLAILPFACQYCGKRFGTLLMLQKQHIAKGRCKKRFQCHLCLNPTFFSKQSEFDTHTQTHVLVTNTGICSNSL